MKTFHIQTLGCKVNQYESQQMFQWLCRHGFSPAADDQPADLAVINTCCVTRIASAKSRQLIRKIQKHNPLARIIFTGCLTAGPKEELKNLPESVILAPKDRLSEVFKQILTHQDPTESHSNNKTSNECKIKHKKDIDAIDGVLNPLSAPLASYQGQTRAFLKIQDGCDVCCSYCIIPKTRKKLDSKPLEIVLHEAKSLVDFGHPEIVLTGIHIGAWGQKSARRRKRDKGSGTSFARLIDQVAQIPGLLRLRISSLEPADLTDELLDVYGKHPNLAPHFHLSLQSGSDNTLRRMARQYSIEEFLEKCEKIKHCLDRPAITTDIIVGFPGETDQDFRETLEVCRIVQFAKIHVFPFSLREGTAAAEFTPRIPPDMIRNRADVLNHLDNELQEKFRRQFIGEKVNVIVENESPVYGRCERYFMVQCDDSEATAEYTKGQLIQAILKP